MAKQGGLTIRKIVDSSQHYETYKCGKKDRVTIELVVGTNDQRDQTIGR